MRFEGATLLLTGEHIKENRRIYMQRRMIMLTLAIGIALMFVSSAAMAQYQLTNLVSNQVGQAKNTDPLLVNAWGLVHAPGSPFWISDNATGWETLYTGTGAKIGLEVVVPSASGKGPGSPTGVVFNGSPDGEFQVAGWPSIFIFATLDGTISGWAPQSNPNQAIIAATNAGTSYTGLAITNNPSGNMLFAADNAGNKVDMYDGTFTWKGSFTDATVPTGFSVLNVQDLNGLLYVSYAATNGGPGGFIDIFSEGGVFLKRLAQGGPLNQPWGFAAAPRVFGALSNTLLISNNVNNGTINGFNAITGEFVGSVRDKNGKLITIDQLWGIEFGGGTAANGAQNELFFTAGPSNNQAGTFGVIRFTP
jgi:uncharacterized protein (TIGR03118 family)